MYRSFVASNLDALELQSCEWREEQLDEWPSYQVTFSLWTVCMLVGIVGIVLLTFVCSVLGFDFIDLRRATMYQMITLFLAWNWYWMISTLSIPVVTYQQEIFQNSRGVNSFENKWCMTWLPSKFFPYIGLSSLTTNHSFFSFYIFHILSIL